MTPVSGAGSASSEYERKGALCYLAAWDARRTKLFDHCARADGIVPFDALVEQYMPEVDDERFQSVVAGPFRPGRARCSAWSCSTRSLRASSTRT